QGQQFSAMEGVSTGTVTVATFNSNAASSQFTASIDWGDGQTSTGAIQSGGNGVLSVQGSNTYAEEGSYVVTVTLTDSTGSTSTSSMNIQLMDAPLTPASAPVQLSTVEGPALSQVALVTFQDANPNSTVTEFTCTVNWGDGTQPSSSSVTITAVSGSP